MRPCDNYLGSGDGRVRLVLERIESRYVIIRVDAHELNVAIGRQYRIDNQLLFEGSLGGKSVIAGRREKECNAHKKETEIAFQMHAKSC